MFISTESEPTSDFLKLKYHDQSTREVIITETTSTSSKPLEFVTLLRELSDVVSARWEDIGLQPVPKIWECHYPFG